MSLRDDVIAAQEAAVKLNRYSAGVHAAGGKDATKKYLELNRKANEAIRKLPSGFMRTREGLALSAMVAKAMKK